MGGDGCIPIGNWYLFHSVVLPFSFSFFFKMIYICINYSTKTIKFMCMPTKERLRAMHNAIHLTLRTLKEKKKKREFDINEST